ncbi:MAG: 4-hydroxy-tetrahydrodipicolinate synthase [Candidatus Spyradocola sp.]
MSEKRLIFTGSAAAMVTPFQQEGLNVKALDRLIDFQLAGGTDALVVCGTTGEPSTMDISEEAVVISRTVERVNRRVPVIAGAGSNDTAFAVMSAKQAKNLGADALLLVTPYYNKTSQQGLIRHFLTIADATDLPIILYNVPSRTGLNLQPATLRELAKHDNIVAVKEASGNLEQIVEIAATCPELALYSGCDDQVVPMLALGGKGVISVVADILPRQTHDMVRLWMEGDHEGSRRMQFELMPIIKELFSEVNPIPVKTALNDMGFDCGPLRLPLIEMQPGNHERLRAEMKKWDLI